ncbi:restriction endonuclease subunit S [Aggregatibacter aphrophilus]|uniref:Type I restriction modification DNA specificity domain-containing protein n=1 Tax=Aggregatibacter aphrophilus TaxID=732 RepID=A0AAP7GXD0_AGGAP|nr:restriction endonuclease subunit S [Aggregatibacter aphrophilus]OBY49537.1 hypothetical protein BBB52_10710 [Aggregatibacter aphrophilus]
MKEDVLPEGWEYKSILSLIPKDGIISDGDWIESKDQDVNGDVRLIQLADIGDGEFKNKSRRYLTSEKAKELNCTYLKPNDILIARMPDPIGRACVFPEIGQKSVTAVDICIIRLGEKPVILAELLVYWVNSSFIRNQMNSEATGTTRKRITRKKLEQFKIPLPPLPEQQYLSQKLTALLDEVAQTKQRLEAIPALLKQFRQSVLADAVSGKLTEENANKWNTQPLKSLTTKIGSGSTPKGGNDVYKDSGISFVRSLNIHTHFIKYEDLVFIDEVQAEKLKNVKIEENDVLLNITGASIGRVNIAPKEFVNGRVNQHVAIIRLKQEALLPTFLHLVLASPKFQKWIEGENYGTTRQALTKGMLEILEIHYPDIATQTQIVQKVETYFALADEIETQVNAALENVNLLTQSILAKAFSGELSAAWRKENSQLIQIRNNNE